MSQVPFQTVVSKEKIVKLGSSQAKLGYRDTKKNKTKILI